MDTPTMYRKKGKIKSVGVIYQYHGSNGYATKNIKRKETGRFGYGF
jgi:hypothetical protein